MNKNRLVLCLFSFCCIFSLFSCQDEKEKIQFELDKKHVLLNIKGENETVKLLTNIDDDALWEIQDVPDWLSVRFYEATDFYDIVISADENMELSGRKGSVRFVCGTITRTLEVEQEGLEDLDPFIEFDKAVPTFHTAAGSARVKIISNTAWEVTSVPFWVSVSPRAGNGSEEILITTYENDNPEGREGDIIFTGEGGIASLPVSQFGLRDFIVIPRLPIFSFKQTSTTVGSSVYEIKTNSLFVNPEIREQIYLGNLLSPTPPSNTEIPGFTGYTFNPITVSTSAALPPGQISTTYVPSRSAQDAFAQKIASHDLKQILSFTVDISGTEFYNHKTLHAMGMINLGIKLDELVSGYSYKELEMGRRFGMIFSFKRAVFSLDMDLPDDGKVVKEDLKPEDETAGVAYVGSMTYGKVGLLVVECDTDRHRIRTIVNRVINDEPLYQDDPDLIRAADITYVYFTNYKEVKTIKGYPDAIHAYRNAMDDKKENIYPLEFSVTEYPSHAMGTLSFTVEVP